MPDASSGAQHGTVNGNSTPTGSPGLDQVDQVTIQAANLCRQGSGDGFQAPLPARRTWERRLKVNTSRRVIIS